jgi:hypothetical protein
MAEKKITPKKAAGTSPKGEAKTVSTGRKNKRVMSAKVKTTRVKRFG